MKFKKLPTKPNGESGLKPDPDYMLPRLHIPHEALSEATSHSVGRSHVLSIKAKKIAHDERGSTYKVTHIAATKEPKAKKYLLKN